jgi:hypothetical protein
MTPDLLSRLRSASHANGNEYELCLSIAEVRAIVAELEELAALRQQVSVDRFCEGMRQTPMLGDAR